MILTSRQLAMVVWLVIFVALGLTVKGVRSSVRSMLATLFSPKLLALFAIIIGYNVAGADGGRSSHLHIALVKLV